MTRLHPTLALAAALCLGGPPLAAQVSPPNPFAVERAERNADGWHPRMSAIVGMTAGASSVGGAARASWRSGRAEGRRWEHHGERLERRGYEHRGRKWERKGERLQHRGDRLEHRGERFERRGARVRRHGHHGDGTI